ncbi:MAG: ABC transporter substrate-binding protein [Eubacteriales bacterium]|nr:ABC transporter substrate-binding protein [Eubacteriales bacterium]
MLNFNQTIYDAVSGDRDLLNFLLLHGFEQLKNPKMLEVLGKTMTLGKACDMRGIDREKLNTDYEAYRKKLEGGEDITLRQKHEAGAATLKIRGILPCPIRVPLLELFDSFIKQQGAEDTIDYDLRSANLGLDWMEDEVRRAESTEDLPDVFMSAGFKLFFDKELIGKFVEEGAFRYDAMRLHDRYRQPDCMLEDPQKNYYVTGTVPAVFIINHAVLGDRPVPQSWEDLMQPIYYNDVAVPMGDLDLFNAILISLYDRYGMDAVRKLGRNFATDLHPSQMVKKTTPAISISPYFFACMIRGGQGMSYVWPTDGAVASPIFTIIKKSALDRLQPFLEFLTSEETTAVFSANGKFPCTDPKAKDILPPETKLLFPSWDLLNGEDITSLLDRCEAVFYEGVREE